MNSPINKNIQTYDPVTRQILNLKQNTQMLTHIPSGIESNRVVLINCTKSTDLYECIQATIQIKKFIVGSQIAVVLKFAINLVEIGKNEISFISFKINQFYHKYLCFQTKF